MKVVEFIIIAAVLTYLGHRGMRDVAVAGDGRAGRPAVVHRDREAKPPRRQNTRACPIADRAFRCSGSIRLRFTAGRSTRSPRLGADTDRNRRRFQAGKRQKRRSFSSTCECRRRRKSWSS